MLSISPPATGGDKKPPPEDTPVLCLTHFSRPPFVSFGCVRPGSARSVVLLLQNPSEDPAVVTVHKLPEHRGFSVPESEVLVPPFETLPLTITWTPLEEGAIRELLTFLLNDVVKHQAVLLGRAEAPAKKRSRWNSVKKKYSPKTKAPCSQDGKNKTFVLPQKSGRGTVQRTRSPLQSCENLYNAPSPVRESRRSSEHRLPAALISPLSNLLQDFTPGSLRRSKTYSVLCTTEYSETIEEVTTTTTTTSTIQRDMLIEEEWTLSEQRPSKESISPIHPGTVQHGHFICTPSIIHEHTDHPVSSPTEAFKTEVTVTRSQTSSSFHESSHELRRSVLSRNQTPPPVLGTPQRNILSPDSFVNNSYGVSDECLTAAPPTPILSPDQFVKENFLTPPAQSVAFGGFCLKTPSCETPVIQEEVKVTRTVEDLEPPSARLTFCVKKQNGNGRTVSKKPIMSSTVTKVKARSPLVEDTSDVLNPVRPPVISDTVTKVQDGSRTQSLLNDVTIIKDLVKLPVISVKAEEDIENQPQPLLVNGEASAKGPVKPPIASATVVKVKAADRVEMQHRPQPKSRRRLKDIETDGGVDSQAVILPDLPVINVSDCSVLSVQSSVSSSESSTKVSKPMSICGRKRRSEEISRDATVTSCDSLQSAATLAKKMQISKPPSSQHVSKRPPQNRSVNSSMKKAGNGYKIKAETVKVKPMITKTYPRVLDSAGLPPLQSALTFKNSKRIVAVAQSKLTFMRPPKTVIPRHPMPFAAKNMFYDERWMAKQERGFTWWLNFILTPDDFAVKTDSMKVNAAALILGAENNHKASVPKAPTKEEVSLKSYTARCRLNKLRRSACRLFTSEAVVRAIRRLEVEIEARRLLVRKDRHLWKDIGERQKIMNWLLSYNPLWLRVGLETIFGELISLESNSDVTGLAVFILNRLLWNPDIAAEYRHPSVPHLYRDGHEEALSKFTLKKLLLLVFFLDYAKQSRLIDHDPCLFCKDAEFKASKDLLLAFSRDFLSGEGDLSRHLGYLGLAVGHVQTPLDEFDFAVTNLAVDLQCGVRLVRMMELLTQNWSLSKKLRVPAISRLQKMHNVEVAFHVLTQRGVEIKDERGVAITSKDIVDRHRERTLALLWNIVFTFQVDILLNTDHLKEEIKFLRRTYSVQKKLAALRAFSATTISKKRVSDTFTPDNYSERVLLLIEWVNAVCAFYSTKVENFTVSFSDGRVFCYLLNHYHPSYVPSDTIRQRTTQTIECSKTATIGLNSSSDSDSSLDMLPGMYEQGSASSSALFEELLQNEKANFSLVQNAVSDLGGIPAMILHSDMSNTIPDEKVVIIYLSFLCARLLDIRKEARAARVIQAAWRKHRLAAEEQLLQKKHRAACVVQRAVRGFLSRRRVLKRTTSAVLIQKHWRRYQAYKELVKLRTLRRKEIETCAAVVIQKYWRGFAAVKYYRSLKAHVVLIQARVRAKIAVASYKKTTRAARVIQDHVRSWRSATKQRNQYLRLKAAAAVIQAAYRRWKCSKMKRENKAALVLQKAYRRWQERKLEAKTDAAITIQSQYRMFRQRRQYRTMRAAALKIQSLFKMKRERRRYLVLKKKVSFLQRLTRAKRSMLEERKSFCKKKAACIRIQSAVRGYLARKNIRVRNKAATTLQAHYRMHKARKEYLATYRAALVLQRRLRAHNDRVHHRKTFLLMKQSAIRMQATYRGYVERKRLRLQRAAAITIQTNYRCYRARKRHLNMKVQNKAATTLQAYYRMHKARKEYLATYRAALVLQRRLRAHNDRVHHRKTFLLMKQSAVRLQATYRGYVERKRLRIQRAAAITIQANYRCYRARKSFLNMKVQNKAATTLQAHYRMHKARKGYLATYRAALVLQRRIRAHNDRVHHRKTFLLMKQSAVRLQATYRGYVERKRLRIQLAAAITIQANYRCYRARKRHLNMRQSVVTIQRWYKGQKEKKTDMQNFLKTKRAVVVIQSAYRGFKVRRQLGKQNAAAVVIQSAVRRSLARKEFVEIKKATVTIQRRYRAVLRGREERQKYLHLCLMVRKVQAIWRGRKARLETLRLHQAASLIQSYYRMYVCRTKYKTLKQSTELIQTHYRAYVSQKCQRSQYLRRKAAVTVLQAACRGWKTRKNILRLHKAAGTIQAYYRSYRMRRQYLKMRMGTTTIQRWYRTTVAARRERAEYVHLRRTVIKLQSVYRGVKTRQRVTQMRESVTLIQSVFRMHKHKVEYQKMRRAAVVLQQQYRAVLRGRKVREQYVNLKKAACAVQATWRGRSARRQIGHMHVAAAVIQSQYRMIKQRRYFINLRRVTIAIQRRYRASLEKNTQMILYCNMRRAALCIQSSFRAMQQRREFQAKRYAAMVIQRNVRSLIERRRFLALQKAAIIVQRRFKLKRLVDHHRQEFLKLRRAVLVLQAAYRGFRERKTLQDMRSAAIVIQSTFRKHKTQMYYRNLKCASITIQRHYRSYRSALRTREEFLKLRESAIKLQAAYRGAKTRRAITKRHQAASKIQAAYRMYISKRNYEQIQWAVRVMQQRYRAKTMREFEVLRYAFIRDATTCIQAGCRGWHVRKERRNQSRAAMIIQRLFRTYLERRRYLELKETTIRIQRLYRATVAMRRHYWNYQSQRKAASLIQAFYRGYKIRKEHGQKHKMAARIQAYFRMHRSLVVYRAQREAACKIQMWYRSVVECRGVRGRFLRIRSSAVTIQAAFRGMRVRRDINAMNKAATVIQSGFRMYVHHTYYKSLIKATKTIQQRYREKKSRDRDLHLYQTTRRSVILLQAAFRGGKVRRQIKSMHRAATSIQKCVKAYQQRTKYVKLRAAAVCLQGRYRALVLGRSECAHFLKLRKSAVCIQSAWRAYKTRDRLERKRKAAVAIQSSYRMYRQRKSYIALQQAARTIQSRFRANMLRDEAVRKFTKLRSATRCIQSAFRAMKRSKELRRTAAALVIQAAFKMHRKRKAFLQMKSAAVAIQAAFRAYLVRKRLQVMEASARCIQNWFRRGLQSRVQRAHYVSVRTSAIVIQSAFRGLLVRRVVRQEKAAIKIQAHLRMVVCRRKFLLLRSSAVALQALYRMHRDMTLYHKERTSAILLQQRYRSLILMRQQRMEYLEFRGQVIRLQSAVRRYCAQRRFKKARCAAVIIQTHWRRYVQRQIFFQHKQAALILQQRYRARCLQMIHRHHYRRLRAAAIVLQAAYRGLQTRTSIRKEKAACVIQRYYRSWTVRRDYSALIRTVGNLQRRVRAKQERARFIRTREAAVCIQRRWRETLVSRMIRKDFVQKQEAAKRLQSVYRGHVVRTEIHKMQRAACVIQSAFRGFWQRQRYLRLQAAAVTFQRRFRALQQGRCEQLHYMRVKNSVIRLQACARGWMARKQVARLNRERRLVKFASAVRHHLCAVRIQRYFRKHLILRKARTQMTYVIYIQRWYRSRVQQRNFHETRQKTITVQRAVRAWLQRRHEAAAKIQRYVRVFLQRRKRAKVMSGVVKFQALWRGHQWRKHHDTKAVKKLRTSLRQVNEQIKDEDRLCNRTVVALNYLLTYKHLSFILAALQHLEVATRLSSVCCENMAQSGAIKTIFTLIRSCNRSLPCMEVIKLSIQVLLNLTKYEKTASAVYEAENSVEVLLDLMQIYREKAGDKVSEKGGSIFTKTCCLLAIFALNSQRVREIRAIPKAVDRINSIYKLTARKHKMDTARNIRQQLNSSQNLSNISFQATPVRTRIVSRIKPDWVLRKDNMREVVDPLKAIQMVMVTFGVPL